MLNGRRGVDVDHPKSMLLQEGCGSLEHGDLSALYVDLDQIAPVDPPAHAQSVERTHWDRFGCRTKARPREQRRRTIVCVRRQIDQHLSVSLGERCANYFDVVAVIQLEVL